MVKILKVRGKVSWFGGPSDTGVKPAEGLALFEKYDLEDPMHRSLFLSSQPPGTTGLARRLNPEKFYVAARWNYEKTPREWLRVNMVEIVNLSTGKKCLARPTDWGPHATLTDKSVDVSPGIMKFLALKTGDRVELRVHKSTQEPAKALEPAQDPRDNYENAPKSSEKEGPGMIAQLLVPILISLVGSFLKGKLGSIFGAIFKTEKTSKSAPSQEKEDRATDIIIPKKKQDGGPWEAVIRALIQAGVGILNEKYPKEDGGFLAALDDTNGRGQDIVNKLLA